MAARIRSALVVAVCLTLGYASANLNSAAFDAFPELDDVGEMANLSHSVYQYKKFQDTEGVCDDWNNNNNNNNHDGTQCHWYQHAKKLGTQVMIVSNKKKDYLAVVFAGTDDLLTTLLDVDVRQVNFGTGALNDPNMTKIPVGLDCLGCKVHDGFNSAVFGNHIFDDVYVRVEALRGQYTRLFTTGHSLGAANSMLTALALAVEFEKKNIELPQPVTSLNFGGPQVGNQDFQKFIHANYLSHSNTTRNSPYLSIWRFVLGWDLVPRLPEFFYHIGHTIQMHHPECKEIMTDCYYDKWIHPEPEPMKKEALTYYHHCGNESLEYAGVPSGWSSKPYLWVPGALLSHAIARYAEFFYEWQTLSQETWIHDFVPTDAPSNSNSSSDAMIDDDTYAEPPDDDAAYLLEEAKESDRWQRDERHLRAAAKP